MSDEYRTIVSRHYLRRRAELSATHQRATLRRAGLSSEFKVVVEKVGRWDARYIVVRSPRD